MNAQEPSQRKTPAESTHRRRMVFVEFPPSGGLFQFSLQLAAAMAARGHDVQVLTGPKPELSPSRPGLQVRSILPTWHPTAGDDAPELWRRLRRGIRAGRHVTAWIVTCLALVRLRPDVVFWSAWRFPVDGWMVRVLRRLLPRTALVLVAHEPRPLVEQPGGSGFYKTGWGPKQLAMAYQCLDLVLTLGVEAQHILTDTWRPTCPVRVIPHGDERVFLGETAVTEVTPVACAGPHVLFFGTLTRYKGIDDLLAAWPAVKAAVPSATLKLAGAVGADIDRRRLQQAVSMLDGVTLQPGYVPVEQVASLFGQSRVVALPYRRASQSGVAHLAFTFGRPVVATAVGDIPSVVRDERSGLLVPSEDPPRLAEALVRILADPALAEQLGSTGGVDLASGASWDLVAGLVEEALPR